MEILVLLAQLGTTKMEMISAQHVLQDSMLQQAQLVVALNVPVISTQMQVLEAVQVAELAVLIAFR